MKTNAPTLVLTLIIFSILFFCYMLLVCEKPFIRNAEVYIAGNYFIDSDLNAMWNIIITMTTIGYGDLYPKTTLGRSFVFLISIWGIFVISLLVLTITSTLSLSNLELKSINVMERVFIKTTMK